MRELSSRSPRSIFGSRNVPWRVWSGAVALVLAVFVWLPAAAQAQETSDHKWITRVSIGRVFVDSSHATVPTGDSVAEVSAGDGKALLFDISRKISPEVFVQAGLGYWTFPSTISGGASSALDGFNAAEYHLGVLYEFSRVRGLDMYAGPLVVGLSEEDANVSGAASLSKVTLSSAVNIGAQGGVRIQGCLCHRVAIDVNVRWNRLRPRVSGGDVLSLNPWTFSVGFIFRH